MKPSAIIIMKVGSVIFGLIFLWYIRRYTWQHRERQLRINALKERDVIACEANMHGSTTERGFLGPQPIRNFTSTITNYMNTLYEVGFSTVNKAGV